MIIDQRPWFDSRPVLMGFMVGKVALGLVLPISIISLVLHIHHAFIYIMLALDNCAQ
jgi:hypothetical protein